MYHKEKRLGNLELAAFCDQIASIVASGIPTYEGISILMEDAADEDTKLILNSIYQPLSTGCPFHEVLAQSGVFPPYAVHMIEVGEMSGKLEEVLTALKDYYKREENIRSGVRSAVTYPLIIIGVMIAVIFVMILKVIPVFQQIYSELGMGLSGFALIMMKLSSHLNQYLAVIIVLLALLFAAIFFLFRSDTGRHLFQKKRLSMMIAAERFANCMALTLSSGLDTDQGLDLALKLVDNPYMEKRIRHCKKDCEFGKSFSAALHDADIFDKIYASRITIAAKTGTMDQMLHTVCNEYEDAIDAQISHFLSILEPALNIILSVIIGLILIAFLFPLVGIMTSIG